MSDEAIREAAALSIARSEELWGAQPHDDEWQDYAGGAVIDAVRPLIEARQQGEVDRLRAKVDDLAFEVGAWMRRAAEVEDLRRWKAEAMEVLAEWEKVYEALGRPGPLGSRKSAAALAEIQSRSNPGGEHDR